MQRDPPPRSPQERNRAFLHVTSPSESDSGEWCIAGFRTEHDARTALDLLLRPEDSR